MTLELSDDEALVFFEWLARHDERDVFPVDDKSEELVLVRLHGQLEKMLVEPFRPDYGDLVDQARRRVIAAFIGDD